MKIALENYLEQNKIWPQEGRHILAHFDDSSVVVYQAYAPRIGHFAATHGYFGGDFSLSRMSWIKPNFLWMMYRSGWGTKPDQEVTLAVRIQRRAFDAILREAVSSSHEPQQHATREEWQASVSTSSVRLQWDPDHSPTGEPVKRRAVQLGLRAATLTRYAKEWIVSIEDISEFVSEQRELLQNQGKEALMMPVESVYPVADEIVARKLGM